MLTSTALKHFQLNTPDLFFILSSLKIIMQTFPIFLSSQFVNGNKKSKQESKRATWRGRRFIKVENGRKMQIKLLMNSCEKLIWKIIIIKINWWVKKMCACVERRMKAIERKFIHSFHFSFDEIMRSTFLSHSLSLSEDEVASIPALWRMKNFYPKPLCWWNQMYKKEFIHSAYFLFFLFLFLYFYVVIEWKEEK